MIENVEGLKPQSAVGGRWKYWAPPIIWMSAIFFFSTDIFSGENTGSVLWKIVGAIYPDISHELFDSIHFYIRKSAHFTVYAILALLLFRAFRAGSGALWRWRWALYSLLIVMLYALLDEYHQTFTRHRTPSIYDSLIDTSGAMAALVLLWLIRHRTASTRRR
ncbi:MAG: VanZ family protein [Chloracidobacterium sp.]|nr:VanZ family protein [Chloracidobacterium sp.]